VLATLIVGGHDRLGEEVGFLRGERSFPGLLVFDGFQAGGFTVGGVFLLLFAGGDFGECIKAGLLGGSGFLCA
jgi:hypothetical protein